ncbi:MAG TPA: MM0924 family protein [Pyrinomonadaceae bacterium]|nr:MM0924 family protein [Pyrinomonadaceae bacterium]
MEKLLSDLMGKIVDLGCGTTAVFRGEVTDVKDGVLSLRDEEGKVTYISADKIVSICERSDSHSRPGFIG